MAEYLIAVFSLIMSNGVAFFFCQGLVTYIVLPSGCFCYNCCEMYCVEVCR